MRANRGGAVVLIVSLLVLAVVTHASAPPASSKPELRRVVIYMWALSTGGVSVDLETKRIECFTLRTELPEAQQAAESMRRGGTHTVFHILADASGKEVDGLKIFVEQSSLRGFTPRKWDIRPREARLDECPPTLVLVWSDKTERFSLPLSDTVREDLAIDRKRAYEGIDEVCGYLLKLQRAYDKKPYVSVVAAKGGEYERFTQERDRLTKGK